MSILLLRLTGMQSWGTRSRFCRRDTELHPSKSGVFGLLCAALGKPRIESTGDGFPTLPQLSQLKMAIRVDRQGSVACDYQTASDVLQADGKSIKETELSWRDYISDGDFVVALEGDDDLIERLADAVRNPVHALYLGRKAFPPTMPVFAGVVKGKSILEALSNVEWLKYQPYEKEPQDKRLKVIIESDSGRLINDIPIRFVDKNRMFAARTLEDIWIDLPIVKEWITCGSQN